MINVLFVCHGNICRSPMAEYLFKAYVGKKGISHYFEVASAATSNEEVGNPVHYGTKKILSSLGIDCSEKRARQIRREDYERYNYIIGMDEFNIRNLKKNFTDKDKKIFSLLDFTEERRDIEDPWYTGNFSKTYQDIQKGIEAFFQYLSIKHNLEDYS